VTFIERLSFKKRFESPATLALFGAFAVPEPFGTIILAYAAFWWWRSRKIKAAGLSGGDEPPLAADIASRITDCLRLFDLSRNRRKRSVELGANAVHRRHNDDGNAGGDYGVFNRGGGGVVLHEGS
jgi:hypothetical protein